MFINGGGQCALQRLDNLLKKAGWETKTCGEDEYSGRCKRQKQAPSLDNRGAAAAENVQRQQKRTGTGAL